MAGEPRSGGRLSPGGQQFRGDGGSADAAVASALAAYAAGEGSERAALAAFAASRFLVPVVAMLGERDETGAEKDSVMALPKLIGRDGRAAIIAFTCLDALSRWRPDARPIPAEADRVWRAAVADGCAVIIDVAGPIPLAVEGARLAALAEGRPVPEPHEDPDIQAEIQEVIAAEPAISGVRLGPGSTRPGPGSTGTDSPVVSDLSVEFVVAPEAPGWEQAVRSAAEQISVRLARRLSRGMEISAVSAG
ncbi:MAG TPA: SseB family protein [Streptosporangiaceae bacterium]